MVSQVNRYPRSRDTSTRKNSFSTLSVSLPKGTVSDDVEYGWYARPYSDLRGRAEKPYLETEGSHQETLRAIAEALASLEQNAQGGGALVRQIASCLQELSGSLGQCRQSILSLVCIRKP